MEKILHVSKDNTWFLEYIAAFTDLGLKERERLVKTTMSGMIKMTLIFNSNVQSVGTPIYSKTVIISSVLSRKKVQNYLSTSMR